MTDLKLLALDGEDLEVISAYMQDAVVRVEDLGFAPEDQRFALLANRFAWEMDTAPIAGGSKRKQVGQRKRAALRFDRVTKATPAGIDLKSREGVLELLSIGFEPGDLPNGHVTLLFAGGGTIVLDVECLEGRLHDLGAAWSATATPVHDEID
jgi:hypothetical protein